jgi:hypothetical protein
LRRVSAQSARSARRARRARSARLRSRQGLRDLKLLQNHCSTLFFFSKIVLAHFSSFTLLHAELLMYLSFPVLLNLPWQRNTLGRGRVRTTFIYFLTGTKSSRSNGKLIADFHCAADTVECNCACA